MVLAVQKWTSGRQTLNPPRSLPMLVQSPANTDAREKNVVIMRVVTGTMESATRMAVTSIPSEWVLPTSLVLDLSTQLMPQSP